MSVADGIAIDEQGPATQSQHGLGAELELVAWQVFYEQRSFWRNRRRAMASLAFPIMFLLIFGAIVKGNVASRGGAAFIDFYVPGIIAYAVMVLGFSTIALELATLRDNGVIKRIRATPMPWASYLSGIVLSTVVTVVVATILLLAIGVAFYGAHLRVSMLPGLVVTLALGTACFTSLGIAVSRLIPKPDSGMPILMFVTLPLSFISDVFFPLEKAGTLRQIGEFFPLNPLANGLAPAFDPHTTGAGFAGHDLRSLAIWTVFGCLLMVRSTRALSARD